MSEEQDSVELRVLQAIDQAAGAARAPVDRATREARQAKWFAVVAVAGLVVAMVAILGVAKALHDSRQATLTYRSETCARGNAYRADDLAKWMGLLALAAAPDPNAPPKLPSVVRRDAARLKAFNAFLAKADAPVDCAALLRRPN